LNSFKIGDLTIPLPIVQGGMGIGVSLSGLASAVANAGGIGTIATVGLGLIYNSPNKSFRENNIDGLIYEIRKAKEKTKGIVAVNIMTVLTNYDDLVKTSIEEGIDIIFSGAGLPLDLPKYLTSTSKTKLVPIVSSSRAAKIIAQKWKNNFDYIPDAFVVEGPKAGGHLGFSHKDLESGSIELKDLVKETVEVAKELSNTYNREIPVIAGGGILTGEDIYEIFQTGATAVQLGSLFVATEECDAAIEFKQSFVNSKTEDIQIIKSPVGMPGRVIKNDFIRQAENGERSPKSCKFNCLKSCNPKTTSFCIADALLAGYQGRLDEGFVFTGANGDKINTLSTVPEVIKRLQEEYKEVISKK